MIQFQQSWTGLHKPQLNLKLNVHEINWHALIVN